MLYIYNDGNISKIVCNDKIQKAEKPAFSIVKGLSERELFSYESRVKYTKKILNIKTKIPVYINEEILLMPTKAPKRHDTYWINYFEVFSHQKFFNNTIILFTNLKELEIDITNNSFSKMMEKGEKIINYINERKNNLKI